MRMTSDIATALYYTGIDPFTGEEVYVARGLRDRKMQRALMQFLKPENYFMVREALLKAGRGDLIGNGCDCLIPAHPPHRVRRSKRGGDRRTGQKATITIPSPTPRTASRPAATGRGGRRRAARTRNASGTAANQVCGRSQRANKN
jgi:hypothetical protein